MGELAKRFVQTRRKPEREEDDLSPNEQRALDKLRSEAEAKGATLATDGKGGLPPSLVLGVMRRDKFTCKKCGKKKDIAVHHKGGVVKSKWLDRKGHSNDPNNIVTICESCHDDIHEEAREEGVDSSQVTPTGDK